jgi:hypothetical protein
MIKKIYLLLFVLLLQMSSHAQLSFNLKDSRLENVGLTFTNLINEKPVEVQFGISVDENNDVYFSMTNKEWFNKIIKNDNYGISVDIVSKENFNCGQSKNEFTKLPFGTILAPKYKKELIKQNTSTNENEFTIKIGKLPFNLIGKEIEGNLIFCIGKDICYYTDFVNIDRDELTILPMGLFADTLIKENNEDNTIAKEEFFIYSKKIQIEVPFKKSSSDLSNIYLQKFYDSLNLEKYKIKKIEIRAYASVEGSLQINTNLMKQRADAIVKDLNKYKPIVKRVKITSAENWIDFLNSINNTPYKDFTKYTKEEIKLKLTNKDLQTKLEPLLGNQRKGIIIFYLEEKTKANDIVNNNLLPEFKNAIDKKDAPKAKEYLKELANRILDNQIPSDFIKKIEVPKTKEFSDLQNNNEVYKYLIKATSEYEALNNFLELRKSDPTNGKINYNICALRFFVLQHSDDKSMMKPLLTEINALKNQKIDITLIKRMQINYNILKAEIDLQKNNYVGKDSAVNAIAILYNDIKLNEEEVFSLAKFYSNYSHMDWAENLIKEKVDKIDANEDIVFYYINLLFYKPDVYEKEIFQKAILNAINLNKKRWCNFFLPYDKGGASLQLLKYEALKKRYCESCK